MSLFGQWWGSHRPWMMSKTTTTTTHSTATDQRRQKQQHLLRFHNHDQKDDTEEEYDPSSIRRRLIQQQQPQRSDVVLSKAYLLETLTNNKYNESLSPTVAPTSSSSFLHLENHHHNSSSSSNYTNGTVPQLPNYTKYSYSSRNHTTTPNYDNYTTTTTNNNTTTTGNYNNGTVITFGTADGASTPGFVVLIAVISFLIGLLYVNATRSEQASRLQRTNSQHHLHPPDHDTTNVNIIWEAMSIKQRQTHIDHVLNVKKYTLFNPTTTRSSSITDQSVHVECSRHSTKSFCSKSNKLLETSTINVDGTGGDNGDAVDIATDIDDMSMDDDNDDDEYDTISLDGNNQQQTNNNTCTICLEPYRMNDEISYAMNESCCHHEYHKNCISEWLLKHPTCPYCRRLYIPIPTIPSVTTTTTSTLSPIVSTANPANTSTTTTTSSTTNTTTPTIDETELVQQQERRRRLQASYMYRLRSIDNSETNILAVMSYLRGVTNVVHDIEMGNQHPQIPSPQQSSLEHEQQQQQQSDSGTNHSIILNDETSTSNINIPNNANPPSDNLRISI